MRTILVMVIAVFFMNASLASAELTTINGYQPNEFALKGEPKKQIAELVEVMKKSDGGQQYKIAVVGGADVTGKGNDELGLKRAEQVKAALVNAFPDAVIVAWSQGSEINAREVRVEYSLIPKPSTKRETGKMLWLLLLFILSVVVVLQWKKRPTPVSEKTVQKPKAESYEVSAHGLLIPVTVKDGIHSCPFTNASGKPITENNKSAMVRFVEKRVVPGSEFFKQVPELLSTKLIRKGDG